MKLFDLLALHTNYMVVKMLNDPSITTRGANAFITRYEFELIEKEIELRMQNIVIKE